MPPTHKIQIWDVWLPTNLSALTQTETNILKSDLKKSRICPIWGQSDPLWSQAYHPWSVSELTDWWEIRHPRFVFVSGRHLFPTWHTSQSGGVWVVVTVRSITITTVAIWPTVGGTSLLAVDVDINIIIRIRINSQESISAWMFKVSKKKYNMQDRVYHGRPSAYKIWGAPL